MRYWIKEIILDYKLFEGMSVTEIAKRVQVSQSYMSQIKNGQRIATEEMYHRIKNAVIEIRNEAQTNDRSTSHPLSEKVSENGS